MGRVGFLLTKGNGVFEIETGAVNMSDARQTEYILIKQVVVLVATIAILILEFIFPGNYLFLTMGLVLFYEVALLSKYGRGMLRFHALLESARKGEAMAPPEALPEVIRPLAEDLAGLVDEIESKADKENERHAKANEKLVQSTAAMAKVVKNTEEHQDLTREFGKALEALS